MDDIKIGDNFQMHCYKHDSTICRTGSEAILLDIKEDYMVFGNNKSLIIKSDGKIRRTREPAILYFFKDKWFNVIAQIKDEGISYYCNIASPYIIEDGTIKYIDYDLDLKIYTDGKYKILDKMEYKYHKKLMNYPETIDRIVNESLEELIKLYENGYFLFDSELNMQYLNEYNKLSNKGRI